MAQPPRAAVAGGVSERACKRDGSKMTADERARARQRAAPGSRCAFHIGHAWIMCGQISKVTGTSAAPAAAARRVESDEQRLARPDLDQHRRQAPQVGIERRDPRILAVHVRRAGRRRASSSEIGLVNDRIDRVLGGERFARHRQVSPGRHQPERSRAVPVLRRASDVMSASVSPPPALSPPTAICAAAMPCAT